MRKLTAKILVAHR